MQVAITMDLEHDCPPFLKTYKGMEEGAPLFLELMREEGVRATFFATGDVARRFPAQMRRIVEEGHELACHGDTHRRFSTMTVAEARHEIETATACLRTFGQVTSFRAPNLDFPDAYLPLLAESGFTLDSSVAAYKFHKGHPTKPVLAGGMIRVPASTMPSVIRLPGFLRNLVLRGLKEPIVLFFHPWEFVDVTRERIPLDCRFRTGLPALETLRSAIRSLRERGAQFATARSLVAQYQSALPAGN